MRRCVSPAILAVALLSLAPVASADEGWATWYGPGFNGNRMANGQIYDQYDPTGTASNLFPFGTWLQVTNLANGRTVRVQVRDRGAFQHALDLSYAAFRLLDDPAKMWIRVRYDVVDGPNPTPAPTPAPTPERAQLSSRSGRTDDKEVAEPVRYTVQPGDTLWSIAQRYGVSVAALQQANGLAGSDVIQVGQVLVVKGATSSPTPAAGASRVHVVAPGEALSTIAQRYGVSVAELMRANGLNDPDLIAIGQKLAIPGGGAAASQPAKPGRQYVVQPGDSLFRIASRNGVDPADLARLNGLDDPDLIQPGQALRLP